MRKLCLAFAAVALLAPAAAACEQAQAYFMPQQQQYAPQASYSSYSSMQYVMPSYSPSYGYQQSYRVQAPTYIAPSRNAVLGFPAQTPVTIINNNNNNSGGPSGAVRSFQSGASFQPSGVSFAPSVGFAPVGVPFVQNNTFVGRRAFRFAR